MSDTLQEQTNEQLALIGLSTTAYQLYLIAENPTVTKAELEKGVAKVFSYIKMADENLLISLSNVGQLLVDEEKENE